MTHDADTPVITVPPLRPRRWVTLVLCTVIFLAGAVLGTGVTILLKVETWPRPRKTLEERRDQLTERIAGKLSLDKKQTKKLQKIVERRLMNIEKIRQKILPEMRNQSDALDRELRAILKKDQIASWDKLYHTLRKTWFREPSPPKGGVQGKGETPSETQPVTTQP